MITDSFDNKTEAIINVKRKEDAVKIDVCIITFSYVIEEYVLKNFECEKITHLNCATGKVPLYLIKYKGKRVAFYKTYIGAPVTAGLIEETLAEIICDKYIVFGGAGCLDKEIARGKIMVPTEAYRDEGTSYHYMAASDYIAVKNSAAVASFMEKEKIPYVLGKTWTTDAFYRETRGNFLKHKNDGCISVEMECAGVQAMCDFRGIDFYTFFLSGDLLDAPEWDERRKDGEHKGTQHDTLYFDIALELAVFAAEDYRGEENGRCSFQYFEQI